MSVILTVSEVNVRQMPANPFKDSARNINGDRTGKRERRTDEDICGAMASRLTLMPTHSRDGRRLTISVPRGQSHKGAGSGKAGTVRTQKSGV